jgi:two-component system phosphate regulon sensor histidine kinase PhoR
LRFSSTILKLVLVYAVLQTTLTLAITLFSIQQNRKQALAETEEELRAVGWALEPLVQRALESSVQLPDRTLEQIELRKIAQQFHNRTQVRVTVIDPSGVVLVDTDVDPATMANHAQRPEILQAGQAGIGKATRESDSAHTEYHYLALHLRAGTQTLGFLRVAKATRPIHLKLNRRSRGFVAFAAVSTLLASAILFLLGRSSVAPLRDLMQFSKAIASGNYKQKLNQHTWNGDWKLLGNAFEDMQEELEKREGDLRENGNRLSAVLASMSEGIVAVDEHRRVLFANRAAALLLGVPFQDLVHHPLDTCFRHPALELAIESVLLDHHAAPFELEVQRPSKRVIDVHMAWVSQTHGPVVVIVLHDVTNMRQLETMRRDFVANVSHELKTPLSSIKAYSETLRLGAIEDASVRNRFVERIEEQTHRLNDLLTDLIQLARIESGLATFEVTDVNLGHVARERAKAFEVQAKQRQLDMQVRVDPDKIILRCDYEGLVTILDNLISNAVKYTPEGGRVAIVCGQDAESNMGTVQVVDSGLGIAPEFQQRVFERFFRVDRSRSSDIPGTGLGLSIVKHLTQTFSGQVSLTSQPGTGSTFTVRLPLAKIVDSPILSSAPHSS